MKVSIIGTTGYGGNELIRILNKHPFFRIHSIHSSKDGCSLTDEFPHLTGIIDKTLSKVDPKRIGKEADLVFLATPSGISGRLAAEFDEENVQLIDLSGDLRLKDPIEYRRWYNHEAVREELVAKAVYGLSEWNAEQVKRANWISNPGCYPTAALLGLGPIAAAGLMEPVGVIIDAKSGVSGAGKSLTKTTSFAEMNDNFRIYKVNEHQHVPEIEQQLKIWEPTAVPITLSTHLLPLTRGIMATIYVQLKTEMTTAEVIQLYKETYNHKPFIRIREEGNFPSIKEVAGSNYCDIGLSVDGRTGRLTIVSVIDNLVKGAAGQAVQNANLMNGIDETAGLDFIPLYP